MQRARATVLLARILILFLLVGELGWSSDDLEEYLKSNYADKVLTLRHFYTGERLSFQSDGSLVGSAEEGPWTVDGQIQVRQIKRHGRTLEIQGRRVCLVFDRKGKPFRDVLGFLAESQAKDHDKLENFFRSNQVAVDIAVASDKPDLSAVSTVMHAVFLSPAESIRDVVPEYWRDYFDQGNGRSPNTPGSSMPIYQVKSGITPPRITSHKDPEYSEEARRAKYQGTMTVSLVVDPYGSVRDIQIVSPLGLGLDENAVAAVAAWKFNPAMKDGQAVPVKIAAEVSFHLF